MSKSAWQNVGLAVLTVVVLAGAVWVVIKPYPGEPWHPPRRSVAAVVQPEAAFVGDDYVEGLGATAPPRRWSTLVAGQEGWKELNFGQSGTGYVNPGSSSVRRRCGSASTRSSRADPTSWWCRPA